MKLVKRALSILLVLSMLMSLAITTTFAGVNALRADKTSVEKGSNIVVTFVSPATQKAASVDLKLKFDNTAFEITQIANVANMGQQPDVDASNNDGEVSIAMADSAGEANIQLTAETTILLQVTFKAKDEASVGDKSFTVTQFAVYGGTEDEYGEFQNITPNDTVIGSKILTVTVKDVPTKITGNLPISITAPVKGATAEKTTISGTGYTGEITAWSPDDATFKPGTVYTAKVALHAKTTPVAYLFDASVNPTVENATVSNKSVSNDGSTLYFEVTFPATDTKAPLTGTVTISGTPKVGQTLTANLSSDFSDKANITYLWYRDGQPIPNAIDNTYTTDVTDYQKPLTVKVSAKSESDYTGTVTSDPVTITCDHNSWNATTGKCNTCGSACEHTAYKYEAITGNTTQHNKICRTCGLTTLENHSGGNATCKERATCALCNQQYGELAAHQFGTAWEKDESAHWHVCTVEGCTATSTKEAHVTNLESNKATCTKKATCDKCGIEYGSTLEHQLKHYSGVAATCKNKGRIPYWYCTRTGCNAKFQTNDVNDPLPASTNLETPTNPENHETALVKHDRVEPTCSKTGTIEYWHCNSCGNNYNNVNGTGTALTEEKLELAIVSTAHKNIVAVAAKPHTCTEDGYKAHYKCADCNNALFSDAAGTQPTDADKIKDPAAHTLEPVSAVDSTCIVKGHDAYYKCKVCGKMFADNAAATLLTAVPEKSLAAHTAYSSAAHASDATNHWKLCQWCGIKVNSEAHAWNTPAAGEATVCTVCGYVKEKAATPCATGQHDTVFVYDENNHYHVCKKCGEVDGTKGEHSFIESATKAATATEDGWKTELCKECGYVKTTVLPKTGTTTPGGNGGTGGGFPFKDSNKTNNTGKVESQKTFDGGIALYVGLSVLSLTGSALVIRKKKEF